MTDPQDRDVKEPSLERLLKLVGMMTSANDHEAFVAMRKANAEALKFGGWDKILRSRITVIGDPFANLSRPKTAPKVNEPQAPQWTPPTPPPPPPRPANPYHGQAWNNQFWDEDKGRWTSIRPRFKRYTPKPPPPPPPPRWAADPMHATASGPMPTSPTGKRNKFAGRCHLCNRQLQAQEGLIVSLGSGMGYKITCEPGKCQAPTAPAQPKSQYAEKSKLDNLNDLLNF